MTQGRNSRIFPVESFETLIETVYLDFPFKGPFLSLSWHCLFSVGADGNPENIQTLVQPRGSPPDRPERRDRSRVPGLEPQVPSPPCHLLRGPGKTSFLTGTRAVFFTRVPVQLICEEPLNKVCKSSVQTVRGDADVKSFGSRRG